MSSTETYHRFPSDFVILLWLVAEVTLPHVGTSGSYLADAAFRGERRFARNQVQISSGALQVSSLTHSLSLILNGISFPKLSPRRPHLSSSPPPFAFRLPRLPILHGWNFKAGLKWKRRQAGFGKRQLDFKWPLLPCSSRL